MNIARGWKLVRGGKLHYILGRFQVVRSLYSRIRELHAGRTGTQPHLAEQNTLFVRLDYDAAVQAIRDKAVFIGANLPGRVVEEIVKFGREEQRFILHELEGGTFLPLHLSLCTFRGWFACSNYLNPAKPDGVVTWQTFPCTRK